MNKLNFHPIRGLFLLLTIGVFVFTACGTSQPDQATSKSFKIGVVSGGSNLDLVLTGFKAGMAEQGYAEGKNVTYVYDGAVAGADKLEAAGQKLVAAKVDLIVSLGTPATQATQKATAGMTIPVVFVPVADPVKAGIVQSMTNPGGNITGVVSGVEVQVLRLGWLLKVSPNIKRVYVPYDAVDDASKLALNAVKESASKLNVELVTREIRSADDITAALAEIPGKADAILILPGSAVGVKLDEFVKLSLEHKLPLSSPILGQVNSGVLMSYSFSQEAAGKQAARLTDRILKGAKIANLPVENAEFFLAINLKTAQAIGVDVPSDILRQASTIIR
jgi:putative ABC transport system substrate-binding protein